MFTFLFSFDLIYSLIHIINWKIDVDENAKIRNKIEDNVKVNTISNDNSFKEYVINFNKLKEINKDTIAYIKVNNTNID